MTDHRLGRVNGAYCRDLARRIANQCERFLLTAKAAFPRGIEPFQHLRFLEALSHMHLQGLPNHLNFRCSVIRCAEINEVVCECAADLFMYICHRLSGSQYL